MPASIAVIIPCYNHGEYIGEAVASVLAQTVPVAEIIVVDDASEDATREACAALQSGRVKVIRHGKNSGLVATRNTGIRAASSELILPLDADDRLKPNYVERTLPVLESSPEIGWVYTDCALFGQREGHLDFPDYDLVLLLAHDLCLPPALFRRKDWERVGGYDEQFREGQEDWDFWISLAESGLRGARVPERLLEYRQHRESMRIRSHRHIGATAQKLWAKHDRLFSRHAKEIWGYYVGRFYGGTSDPFRSEIHRTLVQRVVRRLKAEWARARGGQRSPR